MQRAMEILNGSEFHGRVLKVGPAMPKSELLKSGAFSNPRRAPQEYRDENNTVFMGNLHFDVDEQIIEEMVADIMKDLPTGALQSVRVNRDLQTKRSKGFAHLVFQNSDQAKAAVERLQSYEVMGRPLRVDLASNGRKTFNR